MLQNPIFNDFIKSNNKNHKKRCSFKLPLLNFYKYISLNLFYLTLLNNLSRMKKLITSSLLLFCGTLLFAQTNTNDDYYETSKPKVSIQDRVTTSIEMGAGVSVFNKSTSGFTTYVAPKIGYQLTPKFKLNVGLMHYTMTGNTLMPLNYNEGLFNASNNSITGNLVFVGGEYQLNKRLIASGAVMADVNSLSNNKISSKAAQIGLEYKVNEHSSIKVSATVGQGQGNYYNNSNNQSLFPFTESNMFGTGVSNIGNTPVIR